MVSHRFPPDAVAGVERYTETLAAELRGRQDEVSVVTRRPAAGPVRLEQETLDNGTRVFRLAGGAVDRAQFLRGTEELETLFRKALRLARPRVVHVNHLIDLSPRFIAEAHRSGAAVVLTLHDFYMACPRIILRKTSGALCAGPAGGRECATVCYAGSGRSRRWELRARYFRTLLQLPERLLCPSPYVRDSFLGFGAPADRTRVVPNGIWIRPSPPGEETRSDSEGKLRLLTLGAVVPHKGHHVVLEALRSAALSAVDFTVAGPIGDPEYVRELRRTADEIRGARLRLYGEYQPAELAFLLQDVDCLIAPSQWPETFCLVTREALVHGVPVLTTRLGALPDAVRDGENGFLFDHDDPGELASHLSRLHAEPALRAALRRGARKTPVPSLSEHATAVRTLYVEALEEATLRQGERAAIEEELETLQAALLEEGFGAAEEAA